MNNRHLIELMSMCDCNRSCDHERRPPAPAESESEAPDTEGKADTVSLHSCIRYPSPLRLPATVSEAADWDDIHTSWLRHSRRLPRPLRLPPTFAVTFWPSLILDQALRGANPLARTNPRRGSRLPTPWRNVVASQKSSAPPEEKFCYGQIWSYHGIIDLLAPEFIVTRHLILKAVSPRSRRIVRRISRHHFVMKLQPMGKGLNIVRLTDLSTYGTYVNGRRVGRNQTITLFDDDFISVVEPVYQYFRFKDLSNRPRT